MHVLNANGHTPSPESARCPDPDLEGHLAGREPPELTQLTG